MGVPVAVFVPYVRSATLPFLLAYLYSVPSVEKVTGRAAAARAVTGSSSTHRHRHSAVPNSRFQILMFNILLSKAHSAFGTPEGCGADPHHNVFCPPAELDSGMGSFIMII